ncbi:MAG: DUF547 domain-containing protein [Salibacteraceae bacterium]
MDLNQLSKEILICSKHGKFNSDFHIELSLKSTHDLINGLISDNQIKSFWLNIYNAYIIKELTESGRQEKGFYSKKIVSFKDLELSFDDIEHGILRRSRFKWSLGYLPKTHIPDWEYSLRISTLDARIHFALNCGANSCPPISVYEPISVDQTLDINSKDYLMDSSQISKDYRNVKIPRLCLWYLADFGGFSGIKALYKKYKLIPVEITPKISFLAYDWSINIDNFTIDKT